MTKFNPLFEWDVLKLGILVGLIQTGKGRLENMYTAGSSAVWNSATESSQHHTSTIIRNQ